MSDSEFPIVEAFGFRFDSASTAARAGFERKWCPFTGTACEKHRQYGFGYCSVSYAADADESRRRVYAVCDHRLDGPPLLSIIADHFGDRQVELVREVVLRHPRTSFDFVAFPTDDIEKAIVIETQAIDLRGGGVGPAWRAWADGKSREWRSYFTMEAASKNRKDTVSYGVNMANIYKRLGLQVATKGTYLKGMDIPLYVLMQDRPFEYLYNRIRFQPSDSAWDICFVTFDYDEEISAEGRIGFSHRRTVRVALSDYLSALSADRKLSITAKGDFFDVVKRKAGLK